MSEVASPQKPSPRLVRISDVAETVSGTTPSRSRGEFWTPAVVPWVKTGEICFSPIRQTEEFVSPLALDECSLPLLPPGTVLVAMYGQGKTRGQSAILEVAATTNQACFAILPNEAFVPEYLQYWLRHSYAALRESSEGRGGNQSNLSGSLLSALEVPWIEPSLQGLVVSRLKAQLAEVDTARQAAQVQLSDTRLLRARMLKAFFAELDAGPKKRLGDYAETTSGVTPARDNDAYWHPPEIAWVKTGEVDFAPITTVKESISKRALAECSLSLLPPKSILIAITGEGKTRGRSAVLEVPAATNQHCFAILPNDVWDADFLQLWLRASYQDLRELSSGRGGSRSALSGAQLKALEIPAPSPAEQQRTVARIQAAMTEIDALENAAKSSLENINLLPGRVLAQAFQTQGD